MWAFITRTKSATRTSSAAATTFRRSYRRARLQHTRPAPPRPLAAGHFWAGGGDELHNFHHRPIPPVFASCAAATSPITAAAAPCRHLFLARRQRRATPAQRQLFAADGRLQCRSALRHQRRHHPSQPSLSRDLAATSGTAAVAAPFRRSSLLWRRRQVSPAPPPPLDSGASHRRRSCPRACLATSWRFEGDMFWRLS